MKKKYFNLIVSVVIIFTYISIRLLNYERIAILMQLSLAPILMGLYLVKVKKKSHRFILFLSLYSLANILHFFYNDVKSYKVYFICNLLYILSYSFLLAEVYINIKIKNIIKKFPIQFSVLILLSVFLIYKLMVIINPEEYEGKYYFLIQAVEGFYNTVLLLLLSTSLLSLLENTTRKPFFMFLGCLFLFLSEVILLDYYYVSADFMFNVISGVIYFLAFLCFYYQATLQIAKKES